jgi:hypothetical protein
MIFYLMAYGSGFKWTPKLAHSYYSAMLQALAKRQIDSWALLMKWRELDPQYRHDLTGMYCMGGEL